MAKPDPAPARPFSLQREASLRRRLAARDEQALVELIDLATPWLLGVAQGMLSDRDEAEEVVQEAFTSAWNHTGALGEEHEALMPWLLRITRNRAIDRLRRRARGRARLARAQASGALPEDTLPPVEPNEAARPGWHVHESVHEALATLPPEQREAVQLAYFRGLTHAEIARTLEIPMGTVKTRLRLALDKLRVALAPIKDWVL
jgi:RNA polymerase sigma-70 factor, ECF subfamily